MSSYRSHMPPELRWTRLAGLGMNEVELRENDQLTDYMVHDLNADPRMPYGDGEFDGAVVTVSVQYMTRPVEIFRDVRRVLKPGAPFIVTYSNRMFPTKAVRIWRALDDRERAALIATYFQRRRRLRRGDAPHDRSDRQRPPIRCSPSGQHSGRLIERMLSLGAADRI